MTATFHYDEPDTVPAADAEPSSLADPAQAALSMINNGPAPAIESSSLDDNQEEAAADISQEEGEPDESVESADEPAIYSDEEYAELCRQADEDFELEVQRLEGEYAKAGVIVDQLSDELKGAKKRQKALMEELRELQADGPDYPEKEKEKAAAPSSQGEGSQSQPTQLDYNSDVPHADPDRLVGETPEWEAYYNIPTASLLADIEGLGKKKLDALVKSAPTTRDLTALTIKAGRYHHNDLSEVLPHGFGKALGERIQNRLLERMPKPVIS